MQRFYWWWDFDLSWVCTTYIGARQLGMTQQETWSKPLFEAYCSGAWFLFWTETTLYWIAKPKVHVDRSSGGQVLHNEAYAAIESDMENLYFWHGVLVPAFVVVKPEWITIDHIRQEENAEVRRVMVERMGWERFCDDAKMRVVHEDELQTNFPAIPVSELVAPGHRLVTNFRPGVEKAQLLESEELRDFEDRPLRFVRLTDPSTGRQYTLRVLHDHARCYEAVGWTAHRTEEEYKSGIYLRHGDVFLRPLTPNTLDQQQHS
jgi:hypothetical protein